MGWDVLDLLSGEEPKSPRARSPNKKKVRRPSKNGRAGLPRPNGYGDHTAPQPGERRNGEDELLVGDFSDLRDMRYVGSFNRGLKETPMQRMYRRLYKKKPDVFLAMKGDREKEYQLRLLELGRLKERGQSERVPLLMDEPSAKLIEKLEAWFEEQKREAELRVAERRKRGELV
jgi:hypothetical protein